MTSGRGEQRERLDACWRFRGPIPLPGPEDGLFDEVVDEWSRPLLDDARWQVITVPHTVTPLSWRSWNAELWQQVWAYRRVVDVASTDGRRVFLDFDAVLTTAVVSVNGVRVGEHRGGYLPFSFEITSLLRCDGRDLLAVVVDARFNINVPPNAPDMVPSSSIDFFQPGGIHRAVWLRTVPAAHVADLALTHHDVLDAPRRRTTVLATLDTPHGLRGGALTARLSDAGGREVAETTVGLPDVPAGRSEFELVLDRLGAVQLWDVDAPHLYDLEIALHLDGVEVHAACRRTGYREADFTLEGFLLNGRRRYLTGANRHEYFPFAGFAMPDRVHRRDAQILRTELNANFVRCSHYPQSSAFLDACDELGLLVWEEPPGWHYLGDTAWQDAACRDIEGMIRRDRHRPSIVIWGARLNETPDHPEFYARTEALVKSLDPSRATSGALHGDYSRRSVFQHDVFAYDDYTVRTESDGRTRPNLLAPVENRPYLISESIAARSSPTSHYHRSQSAAVQQHQALDYAQAHNDAQGDPRYSGLIAWVAFDYTSPRGNGLRGLRTTGLADTFRFLKPGAAFFGSQIPPEKRAVVELAFGWEPEAGDPGPEAIVCSNLERLEFFTDTTLITVAEPDQTRFPNLAHPPFVVDLSGVPRTADLRIDGYLSGNRVLTRWYSGDRASDGLRVAADDAQLRADGVDGTRISIAIVDRFGNPRTSARAGATVELSGPAQLIGEPDVPLDETGGVGAVWISTVADRPGNILVRVVAAGLGSDVATVESVGVGTDVG
jgi:beta-galactosidase